MNRDTRIEIRIRTGGDFREHCIAVPLAAGLARALSEPMEISDEPLALYVDSIIHRRDTISVRNRAFKMREAFAKEISAGIVKALTEYFGRDDTDCGYRKDAP